MSKLGALKQVFSRRWFSFSILFLVLSAFYLGVCLKIPYTSDQASFMLYTKSILEGNVFLKGWYLSTVSYYTTEVPFFILGILLFGFSEKVIYIATAINYSLLAILVIYISASNENGDFSIKKAFIAFSLISFLTILLSGMGMLSPSHLVAYSYIMVCLLSIRYIERTGRPIYYGIFAFFLTLAIIGDSFSLYIFVLPLVIVGLAKLFGDGPKRKLVLILITSSICVFVSKGILKLIEFTGGFTVPGVNSGLRFVEFSALGKSFTLFFFGLLDLFGIDLFGKPVVSLDAAIGAIRLCGLLLFILTLYMTAKNMGKGTFETQILVVAILMNLLEYLFGNVSIDRITVRYLIPSLLFGIILMTAFISENHFFQKKPIVLFFFCATFIVTSFPPLSFSRPILPTNKLSSFLLDHHLEYGYAGYWNASVITMHTQGKVSVRPVLSRNGIFIQPYYWLAEERWYKNDATFLIIDGAKSYNVSYETGKITFGDPDITYSVDGYTILVWNHNISSVFFPTK